MNKLLLTDATIKCFKIHFKKEVSVDLLKKIIELKPNRLITIDKKENDQNKLEKLCQEIGENDFHIFLYLKTIIDFIQKNQQQENLMKLVNPLLILHVALLIRLSLNDRHLPSSFPSITFSPTFSQVSYLEKLSLYLPITGRNRVIDGTDVQHDILDYMPQLHSFTFYICTHVETVGLSYKLSSEDIQQTLTNIGQQHVSSMFNYIHRDLAACTIFSIPFEFDYLQDLGNIFPDIVFSYVTYLYVKDIIPFEHEFFIRIARSFPLLKYLSIFNEERPALHNVRPFSSDNCQLYSTIEYPHLNKLDVTFRHSAYVEQFLNETKTKIPCLTELGVIVSHLKFVTNDFKREETRRNCVKVKKLATIGPLACSLDFYLYFPSLWK
jgi:hypothetical protein